MTDEGRSSPALDYATPVSTRAFSGARLVIGLVATVFLSIGVGIMTMGVLLANRFQQDSASMIAVGMGLVVAGSGLVGSYFFARTK